MTALPRQDDLPLIHAIGREMRRGKWVLLAPVLLLLVLSYFMVTRGQPIYTIEMIIQPTKNFSIVQSADNFTSIINLRPQRARAFRAKRPNYLSTDIQAQVYRFYEKILVSPIILRRVQKKHRILQEYFARQWNAETKEWVIVKKGGLDTLVLDMLGVPSTNHPTLGSLRTLLGERLKITPGPQANYLHLQFRTADVELGKRTLLWLHSETDAYLREMLRSDISARIGLLNAALADPAKARHHKYLYRQLSMLQSRHFLVGAADFPLIADIIQPPVSSDRPSSPKPLKWFIASVVGGLVVGTGTWFSLIVPIRRLRKQRSRPPVAAG